MEVLFSRNAKPSHWQEKFKMLSPGKKNWIKKFFALAELNQINLKDTEHLVGEKETEGGRSNTGIV